MAANAFTWVEIYVQDLERAKTFYEAVFDFKLEKLQTEIPMWALPGLLLLSYTTPRDAAEGNLIGVHSMA